VPACDAPCEVVAPHTWFAPNKQTNKQKQMTFLLFVSESFNSAPRKGISQANIQEGENNDQGIRPREALLRMCGAEMNGDSEKK
jgi:hypothetical protein